MDTYTKKKIEEVYNIALKLGVSHANNHEKDIFKEALKGIAIAALDETRKSIGNVMQDEINKYLD